MTSLWIAAVLLTAPPAKGGADAVSVCEKVTKLTLAQWPKSRKGTKEQDEAFERAKKDVQSRCEEDCRQRGPAFIRCLGQAKTPDAFSKCYQLVKAPEK